MSVDVSKLKNVQTQNATSAKASSAPKAEAKNISAFGKLTTSGKTTANVFSKGETSVSKEASSVPSSFGSLTTSSKDTGLKAKLSERLSATNSASSASVPANVDSVFTRHPNTANKFDVPSDGQMDDKDFHAKGGHRPHHQDNDMARLNRMHGHGDMPQGGHHMDGIRHGDGKGPSIWGHGGGDCGHDKFDITNPVIGAVMRGHTDGARSAFRSQVNRDFRQVMDLDFDDVRRAGSGSGCGCGSTGSTGGCSGSSSTPSINYPRMSYGSGCCSGGSSFMDGLSNIMGGLGIALSAVGIGAAIGKSMNGGKGTNVVSLSGMGGAGNVGNMITMLGGGTGTVGKEAGKIVTTANIQPVKTADVTGTLNANQSAIQKLNDANETDYTEALQAGDAQYAANEQAIKDQNDAVSQANENQGKIEGEISTNQVAMDDTSKSIDELGSKMFTWRNDEKKERDLAKKLEGDITKYGEKAGEANETIEAKKSEIADCKTKIGQKDVEISTSKQNIATLKQRIQTAKAQENANLNNGSSAVVSPSSQELELQLSQEEEKLKKLENEKQELEKQKAEAEKAKGKAETEFKKYSELKTQAETDKSKALELADKFKAGGDQAEQAKTEKEKQLADFQSRKEQLNTSLEQNKQALQVAQDQTAKVTADRDKLVCAQNQLKERMNAVDAQYNPDSKGYHEVSQPSTSKAAKTPESTTLGMSLNNGASGNGAANKLNITDASQKVGGFLQENDKGEICNPDGSLYNGLDEKNEVNYVNGKPGAGIVDGYGYAENGKKYTTDDVRSEYDAIIDDLKGKSSDELKQDGAYMALVNKYGEKTVNAAIAESSTGGAGATGNAASGEQKFDGNIEDLQCTRSGYMGASNNGVNIYKDKAGNNATGTYKQKDGSFIKIENGHKFNGEFEGCMYADGVKADKQVINGICYMNGKPADGVTSTSDGTFHFAGGVKSTGYVEEDGILFKDGIAYTGVANDNNYYKDGEKVKGNLSESDIQSIANSLKTRGFTDVNHMDKFMINTAVNCYEDTIENEPNEADIARLNNLLKC